MENIIYKLINRKKELLGEYPCYYIGSKMGYKPGKYWGSSRHPLLLKELKYDICSFEMTILEYVNNPKDLTTQENYWQKSVNAVENEKYYNLNYARTNFSSAGFKWAHDPISLLKGYFPECKIPKGWVVGKSPETSLRMQLKLSNKTGLIKGDPKLNQIISTRTKKMCVREKGTLNVRFGHYLIQMATNILYLDYMNFANKKIYLQQVYNIVSIPKNLLKKEKARAGA